MSEDSVATESPSPAASSGAQRAAGHWPPVLAALAVLIATQILVQRWVVNHDAALYLHCGRLLTEGLRPYVDFVDLNPPMIMYVSAVPAWLAGLLSIHIISAFHLCVFALLMYSVVMSRRMLAQSGLAIRPGEREAASLLLLLFSFALLRTPDVDWGQREHLFLLSYYPFFLVRWIRWSGGRVGPVAATVSGVLAGFGACLKPHFALLAIIVELALIFRHRRLHPLLHPEAAVFIGVGAAYALHFLFWPAEIREAFFGRWLPMTQRGYGAYNQPWSTVLLRPGIFLAAGSMLGALLIVRGRKSVQAVRARLWILFTVAALLIYMVQQKGWLYQTLPAVFGGLAALVAAGAAVVVDRRTTPVAMPTRRQAALLSLGILATSATLLLPRMRDDFRPWPDPGLGQTLRDATDEGAPILMLSTMVGKIYPLLLQVEREAGSRYLWTFPLPMLYADEPGSAESPFPYRTRSAMGEAELRFLDELGTDIQDRRPQMILIDAFEHPQGCPPGFTLSGYFEAAEFVENEMSDYRYWDDIFVWHVYVPVDAPSPSIPTAEND